MIEALRESHVQAYVNAGFRLFNVDPETKIPMAKGWRNTEPGSIPTALSFGLALQDDDLILDYDPRRNAEGQNQLLELWTELGLEMPCPTFIVNTSGGGFHIYFKKPKDFKVVGSTVPGYPAIEVKTAGRFVIGAGSLHPSGIVYTVYRGKPEARLDAPQVLLDKIRKPDSVAVAVIVGETTDDEVTRQRFLQWIRDNGASTGTYKVACKGKDYGLPPQAIVKLMYEHYNPLRLGEQRTEEEILQRVNHAFEYGQNAPGSQNAATRNFANIASLGRGDTTLGNLRVQWDQLRGATLPTFPSIVSQFCIPVYRDTATPADEVANPLYGILRFNEFSQEIEFKSQAPWHTKFIQVWRDVDFVLCKAWLSQHTAIVNPAINAVKEAVQCVAVQQNYHPVKDYLEALRWDGKPRLDKWLTRYLSADDNRYSTEVGKNGLIGAVARIYQPGCQNDSFLVLEGEQDAGKTSVVRILGGDWFADVQIDPKNKDTYIGMLGCWFLELSEMEFLSKTEVNAFKRFVTILSDRLRMPYASKSTNTPRECVFLGTINPINEGYLRDTTGNRRFWCVSTGQIDLDALRADRDQLFAEAVHRYKAGEPWHIVDKDLKKVAKVEQKKRMVTEVWEETISNWIGTTDNVLNTGNIAYWCLGISKSHQNRLVSDRIAVAMRNLGYTYKNKWNSELKKAEKVWVEENEDAKDDTNTREHDF